VGSSLAALSVGLKPRQSKNIEIKIINFMNLMDLNTGSLDIILSPDNEYVFLEVNPSGQYGMVEYNCFYPLNKIIATKMKEAYNAHRYEKN
jgi:glutathione synthase/RimK-type ligase-like ATP-grasp enzyme